MLGSILRTFEHRIFNSIIDRDDPQIIPNFYAANIENWLIRNNGELQMRDGLTARGASPSATNLGSGVLYKASGTKKFIRVVNGAANTSKFQHSDDGTTWTDISGGGSKATGKVWCLVQANDNVYGVNGSDTPIKYNGSTVAASSDILNGTCMEWWKNFLWVIGVAANPDRVYFSNVNDPETFTEATDFVNVNLGDLSGGVALKGTPGSTGRLYVGKQRSWWFITGSSSSNFALNPLTYEFGVCNWETVIQVVNDVWCVDLDGNIRSLYRTKEDTPFGRLMSEDIQMTISGINRASLSKASAVFFNNYALFFVPNGVDDYNSLVLVWDTLANNGKGGWIKFTNWNIARATVFSEASVPKLFLHDGRTGNGQTYEWTGTSDNGQSIIAKYETKVYDLGYPAQEKYFKYSYQFAPVIANVNTRFYASIDRYYYTKLADVNLLGTGNKKLGQDWILGVDKLGSGGFIKFPISFSNYGGDTDGTTAQFKLEAESSTTKLKLREFTVHFTVRGLRQNPI